MRYLQRSKYRKYSKPSVSERKYREKVRKCVDNPTNEYLKQKSKAKMILKEHHNA